MILGAKPSMSFTSWLARRSTFTTSVTWSRSDPPCRRRSRSIDWARLRVNVVKRIGFVAVEPSRSARALARCIATTVLPVQSGRTTLGGSVAAAEATLVELGLPAEIVANRLELATIK